jgi:ADP-heptose:LPS heptosyltransferase
VDRYLLLGSMLGFDDGPADFCLPVPPAADAQIERLLVANGLSRQPFAVVVPGTLWETKHWRVDGFARTARHLLDSGRGVVLVGANAEKTRCREVADRCPGVCDLSGQTTMAGLAALIRRAEVCVTNDSGSMHLTVALKRPVVSVFGPTDPVWIGPYGRPHAVVRADVECAPCYLRALRKCPNRHACMEQVKAEHVIERIEQIFAKPQAA